jgi:lipoyl(octanoyl) transferase
LSEVAPVITRGRRTPDQDILNHPTTEVYVTDRGGLATYHGPGQWVLFVVDYLEVLTGDRRGVRKAVEALLEIALAVGKQYSPDAHIRTGSEMGVWTKRGKFAAVGVHVENRVLLHGLAVNGFQTLSSFQGLRPCGLDAPVDFLLNPESELESKFKDLGEKLILESFRRFWFDQKPRRSYTLH